MNSVLLIEDSFEVNEELKNHVSNNEFNLDITVDFFEGIKKIRENNYDLLILDVSLAKKADPDFRTLLCRKCPYPMVFIVDMENVEEMECVYGIDALMLIGRPFTASDIYWTINECLKETDSQDMVTIECCGIRMNTETGLVTVDGTPVDLPKKASEILCVLLKNKGMTVSRDILLKEVWGEDYRGSDKVLDSQIRTLRRFLGSSGSFIHMIKGKGYGIGDK